MVFALIIIFWLVLDFYFGRKKHLSIVKKNESAMLYGNFEIFPHGQELFADYFQELKCAKKHIHILFYILKNDAISREFLQILKDKARQGLEVRLLLDRIGSYKVKKETVRELREAGVQFAFSNRVKLPFLFYSSQVRNHRKISIIDGVIGYLGGFNVGKEYIDLDPKLSPWRDYHLKITGESVPFLQREFLIDWKEYDSEDLLHDSSYFPKGQKGSVLHQLSATEARFLEESFIELVQRAQKSITIGTPYFIPSKRVFDVLLGAAGKGIRIKLIVPYTADHILVQEASFFYLRKLIQAGAEVYQFKNGFFHAKTIIVDDQICDIGTANFDKRSLFLNKEINCYIYDAAFTERFQDIIQKDLLDSERITLKVLNKPNFFRSVKEQIAGAISYFL